jgi:hypothetical protein
MQAEGAGQGLYKWLDDEIFSDINEKSGFDVKGEVDQVTAYSMADQGPVIVIDGNISQASKDKMLVFVAANGDLQPLKSSGKNYYHLQGSDDNDGKDYQGGNISTDFESLEDESWMSFAVKNKLIVTSSEEQMQQLLASNGKIAGAGGHGGALIVLTAEKTLLQAGMNSNLLGDDGDADWDSNILRNAEQIAFMLAAAENELVIEAKLITKEADMAQSLASVVRGLIGLTAFSDELDADAIAIIQSTKVKADGKELSITLVVNSDLVVAALSD